MDLELLSGIRTPQDLKRIPIDRLPELAAEIRWAILICSSSVSWLAGRDTLGDG